MTLSVILKLGKYVVPYFHVTVAVTAYCTSRLAAAIFFSTVIVNLGTWTAWTCAVLPEVILFAKFENTLCRNSDLFIPDIESLIILQINRRIKTAGIQTYHLSQELPWPVNGLSFKVISKREITKHFKECTVTCSLTYILNITCTDTFLTGTDSCTWWFLCSCEIWFQWCHSCIDQQDTFIALWNQWKAFQNKMSLAFHEIQKHFSKFVYSVFLHFNSPPTQ